MTVLLQIFVIIFIASLLLLIEEGIGSLRALYLNRKISNYSKILGYKYIPGKCSHFSFRPFEVRIPSKEEIQILYTQSFSSNSPYHIFLQTIFPNPHNCELCVGKKGVHFTNAQLVSYWEGKLSIQSTPKEFSQQLLAQEGLLAELYGLLKTTLSFPKNNRMVLQGDGTFYISIFGKPFNPKFYEKLIILATELQNSMDRYNEVYEFSFLPNKGTQPTA